MQILEISDLDSVIAASSMRDARPLGGRICKARRRSGVTRVLVGVSVRSQIQTAWLPHVEPSGAVLEISDILCAPISTIDFAAWRFVARRATALGAMPDINTFIVECRSAFGLDSYSNPERGFDVIVRIGSLCLCNRVRFGSSTPDRGAEGETRRFKHVREWIDA